MNRIARAVCALSATVAPMAVHAQGVAQGFDCLMEPSQVVEVRSPVDGLIAAVHVKRGDTIRRGQALVELNSAAERAAVDAARYRSQVEGQITAAKNRVQYATAKLARLQELQAGNFASVHARDEANAEKLLAEAELQAATENREQARLELRRTQEQLAMRTMVAPFNGVVLDRMLNPGDLAESGSGRKPALRVAQVDPVKVDIVLPASLFGAVKNGAKVAVVPRGMNGKYPGTVSMVDRVIDAASSTFVARVELPNPQMNIPSGVRCSAEIEGVSQPAARAAAKLAP